MTRLWICSAVTLFFLSNLLASGWAFELNDDGRTLIQEASMAYSSDMDGRPVITDPDLNTYITSLANRLKPKGKTAPTGVTQTGVVRIRRWACGDHLRNDVFHGQ